MVRGYAAHYRLLIEDEVLIREALAWATGRGARRGFSLRETGSTVHASRVSLSAGG